MNQIKKILKITKKWFYTYKKQCYVFLVLSVLFFFIQFPYNESILYLLDKAKEYSQFAFNMNYKSFYLNPIGGPAVVFKEPEIQMETTGQILKAEHLALYPSYKALLTFQPGGGFTIKWSDSELVFHIRKKKINKEKTGLLVSIKTNRLNIFHLRAFFPLLSKLSGFIRLNAELLIDPEFSQAPQGFWTLSAQNVKSRSLSYTFPGSIGTISLPAFQWNRIQSSGTMENGQIFITDTFIGEKADPFQIKTRGIVTLNYYPQSFSRVPRVQIRNYDLGMEIITHSNIKPRLYFLDILFSSVESKTAYGSHYLALLQGNSANFFNLSKISKLPTLEEIRNPPESELEL